MLTEDIAQVLLLEVVFLWNYLAFSTPVQRQAVRQLMEDKQAGVSHDVCLLATSWLIHGAALRLLEQYVAAEEVCAHVQCILLCQDISTYCNAVSVDIRSTYQL